MSTLSNIPAVTRISPRVVRFLGLNPGKYTLQGTNTYLVGTGRDRLLIDSGDGVSEYHDILISYLNTENIRIAKLLITHWHPDHIGGVARFIEESKQKLPHLSSDFEILKHESPMDEVRCEWGPLYKHLSDMQRLHVDGATLTALFTPGHCDDHCCFYLEEENNLFSGDNVLGHGSSVFVDLHLYLESLERMKTVKPVQIYPGHGPVIENAVAKIQEYIGHRQDRTDQIVSLLKESNEQKSTSEITDGIYNDTLPDVVRPAAERVVNLHLEMLLRNKQVQKSNDLWSFKL